jgi:peptide/nickel transport system ATP-binding protein
MLNPLLRSGQHITETLTDSKGKRLRGAARTADAVRRLAEVGILDSSVAARYPFELSGGMRQRVGIAAALARDPEVLIADEPTTALDVTTQKDILALLKSLQQSRGMGLVLITHDLRVAFSMCDRICVLYAGAQLEMGEAADVEREPGHPYTLGMLLSEPPADRRLASLEAIPGAVPKYDDVGDRCAFAPRCRWATDACLAGAPALRELAPGRLSACVRREEIRGDMAAVRGAARTAAEIEVSEAGVGGLIEVNALTKTFPGRPGHPPVRALAGVSLRVNPGESVGVVGESGSGKTTLARCLVGLETADGGRIVIDGIDASDIRRLSRDERRRLRRTIQIVFQDPYSSLNPVRTVGSALREAIEVGAEPGRDERTDVATLLERVGLPAAYASRKPSALSGGERQRVAVARALAAGPRVLVCDEPVSALDVSVQAQVLNLLRTVRKTANLAFVFITHDLAVVRQIADRLYVMYRGEVVEEGSVNTILDSPQHPYTQRLVASIPQADTAWISDDAGTQPQVPR